MIFGCAENYGASSKHTTLLRVGFLTVVVGLPTSSTLADDVYWVGYQNGCMIDPPDIGSFNHGDNWQNFLVPGSGDDAIFGAREGAGPVPGFPHTIHFGDFCVDVFACPNSFEIEAQDHIVSSTVIQNGAFVFDLGPGSTPGGNCAGQQDSFGALQINGGLRIGSPITDTNGNFTSETGEAALTLQNGFVSAESLSVGGGGTDFDGNKVWGNGEFFIINGGELLLEEPILPFVGEPGVATASFGSGIPGPNRSGHGVVSGNDSKLYIDGQAQVGRSNAGSLTVMNGGGVSIYGQNANLSGPTLIGRTETASGRVTVTGAGSSWTQLAQVQVGVSGIGLLEVLDDGYFESKKRNSGTGSSGIVGYLVGSTGEVLISGDRSLWDQDGLLSIGFQGAGSMTIDQGGHCSSVEGKIGNFPGSVGDVLVNGADSRWSSNGNFWIGDSGEGTLTIHNGAQVVVVGNSYIDRTSTSHGSLKIGAGHEGVGILEVSGALIIGESSSLEFMLDPGIIPSVGQQFVLITANGGIFGAFTDIVLPSNADGVPLSWDLQYNATNLILEVIEKNTCPADLNGDGALDFFDVSAFLAAFSSLDPAADFNNDGGFDFFDVSAFLSAFGLGCP